MVLKSRSEGPAEIASAPRRKGGFVNQDAQVGQSWQARSLRVSRESE